VSLPITMRFVRAEVPAPPSGAEILWATEWANSTGSTQAARTDGGRLGQSDGTTTILSVVTKASVGGLPESWPTNLLLITYGGPGATQIVFVGDQWAAPAVGETIYFRFLAYNALPSGSGVANEHGMQSNTGGIHHYWQFFSPGAGGTGAFGVGGSGTYGNDHATVPAAIPMRVEWALTRTVEDYGVLQIRITDESTGTVYTNADFGSSWGTGPSELVDRTLTFTSLSAGFRNYIFGASGSSGGSGVGVYISGFAVAIGTDWIGPYTGREDI